MFMDDATMTRVKSLRNDFACPQRASGHSDIGANLISLIPVFSGCTGSKVAIQVETCGINAPTPTIDRADNRAGCGHCDWRFLRETLFSANYALTRTYRYTSVSVEKYGEERCQRLFSPSQGHFSRQQLYDQTFCG